MREIYSSYDDLERRIAIYLGLGAFVATSFYLYTRGADLFSLLIRGTLALGLFTGVGWVYGHYLAGLLRKQAESERAAQDAEERTRAAEGKHMPAPEDAAMDGIFAPPAPKPGK